MIEIFQAISTFGVPVVLLGVLIYLAYMCIKSWLNRRAEKEKIESEAKVKLEDKKLENEQWAEHDKVFLDTMREIVKELKAPYQHTVEEEEHNRKLDDFIRTQLDCLVRHGANRAYVFSFHNGQWGVDGRSFSKMSLTAESIDSQHSPIMKGYQNVPRMLFPILCQVLTQKDKYNIKNVEEICESDAMTAQFLKEHNANVALFRQIKTENGLVVGLMGVEFDEYNEKTFKECDRLLEHKVTKIVGALAINGEGVI